MTAPPFLTRTERAVAERAFRAAGGREDRAHPGVWHFDGRDSVDLAVLFASPWPAELACLCSPYANDGIFEECPLHGDPSA